MIIIRRYKDNDTGRWTFSARKAALWLRNSHSITVYDNRKERWTYNMSKPKRYGYPILGTATGFTISFRGSQIAKYYMGKSAYPKDNGAMCIFSASGAGCLYKTHIEPCDVSRLLA